MKKTAKTLRCLLVALMIFSLSFSGTFQHMNIYATISDDLQNSEEDDETYEEAPEDEREPGDEEEPDNNDDGHFHDDGYDDGFHDDDSDGRILLAPLSAGMCAFVYCTNDVCDSKNDGDCDCAASCPCQTAVLCPNPAACRNIACFCDDSAVSEGYCICDLSCLCFYPQFIAETTIYADNAANLSLPTGKPAHVAVDINMSSNASTFTDIVFKTYIQSPLAIHDIDITGAYSAIVTEDVILDGFTYTMVEVRNSHASANANAFAGEYNFDVFFPAGVIADGTSAKIFTIIEGIVNDLGGGGSFTFGKEQGIISDAAVITAYAFTEWYMTVESVPLDYKDPLQMEYFMNTGNSNIFRQKIELERDPRIAGGNYGIYYLNEADTRVIIDLPGTSATTTVLRLTKDNGSSIPYTYDAGNNRIIIEAGDIPYNSDFSILHDGHKFSSAEYAEFYIVFDIIASELEGQQVPDAESGGFRYYGLESEFTYDYNLAYGGGQRKDTESVRVIDYVPWQGGSGSIGKWAHAPFVEGEKFFSNAAGNTPAYFSVRYSNNSATPVKDLVITDRLPEMLTFSGIAAPVTATGVRPDAIHFHEIKLTEVSGIGSYEGGTPHYWLAPYQNGSPYGAKIELSVDIAQAIPVGADEIRIEVLGGSGEDLELLRNFSLAFDISVLGNHLLADNVVQATKDERNKINLLRNSARFEAYSTHGAGDLLLSGSNSAMVHVFPFDGIDNPKVWFMQALASAAGGGGFTQDMEINPGRDVFLRLGVSPFSASKHVYDPVFYVELPPEIIFIEDKDNISFSGALSGIDFDFDVRPNPNGLGWMLRIFPDPPGGPSQLLNPEISGWSYLTIKASIHPEASRGSTVNARMYFGILSEKTPLDKEYYDAHAPLYPYIQPDLEGLLGFANEDILLHDDVNIKIRGSGFLEGELWVQTELDLASDTWRRHPQVALGLPGGLLSYKFVVRNGGDLDAENLVLYNVFSHMSDTFVLPGSGGRNSEWAPYLVGPVELGPWAGIATVYYSEYSDHKVTTLGVYSGTDDWTDEPYNWQSVKAIKIEFDKTYILPRGDEIELIVPMFSPVDYTVKDIPGTDMARDLAISSLATQFNFNGGGRTIAIEPLQVRVKLIENKEGEISGSVWGDLNKDGFKNLSEFFEPNITIELWKDGAYQKSVSTDLDGKYKFTNLPEGSYELRAILPDGYTNSGAAGENEFTNSGSNGGKDYVSTPPISVILISARVHSDVNAGISPAPASISGNVWRHLGADGINNWCRAGNHYKSFFVHSKLSHLLLFKGILLPLLLCRRPLCLRVPQV